MDLNKAPLLILILIFSRPSSQCFFPDGSSDNDQYLPCATDSNLCCLEGNACMAGGICMSSPFEPSSHDDAAYYRANCKNQDYEPYCGPNAPCTAVTPPLSVTVSADQAMERCGATGSVFYCVDGGDALRCQQTTDVIVMPPASLAIIGTGASTNIQTMTVTPPPGTSSQVVGPTTAGTPLTTTPATTTSPSGETSTQLTLTQAPTQTPTQAPSGVPNNNNNPSQDTSATQRTIGIATGVLACVGIAIGLALFFVGRKKAKVVTANAEPHPLATFSSPAAGERFPYPGETSAAYPNMRSDFLRRSR